jgi:hypothetical protein
MNDGAIPQILYMSACRRAYQIKQKGNFTTVSIY